MKILVTGATGFVGKILLDDLARTGHFVTAVYNPNSPDRETTSNQPPEIHWLANDLTKIDTRVLPTDVDVLITLAQSRYFRNFPENAADILDVNVRANVILWDWARKNGVAKLIHASTGGIYGYRSGLVVSENNISIASPLDFYLSTKLSAELFFQNFRKHFDTSVLLRPFFIYGPNQNPDMLVAKLISNISSGNTITLHGEEGLKLNPVFVNDASNAILKCTALTGHHILNLAGPEIVSLRSLTQLIGQKLNKEIRYTYTDSQPQDYVGDISELMRLIDIRLTLISKGLDLTLQTNK